MSMLKAATIKIMIPLQCCMVDKKLNELSDEEEWIGDQVTVYKVNSKEKKGKCHNKFMSALENANAQVRKVPQQVLENQTLCSF